jgi:hypothetical protein
MPDGRLGLGKSSLTFDTLYAESQRRYVAGLSSYSRQFLGQGLFSPTSGHEASVIPGNPRLYLLLEFPSLSEQL